MVLYGYSGFYVVYALLTVVLFLVIRRKLFPKKSRNSMYLLVAVFAGGLAPFLSRVLGLWEAGIVLLALVALLTLLFIRKQIQMESSDYFLPYRFAQTLAASPEERMQAPAMADEEDTLKHAAPDDLLIADDLHEAHSQLQPERAPLDWKLEDDVAPFLLDNSDAVPVSEGEHTGSAGEKYYPTETLLSRFDEGMDVLAPDEELPDSKWTDAMLEAAAAIEKDKDRT